MKNAADIKRAVDETKRMAHIAKVADLVSKIEEAVRAEIASSYGRRMTSIDLPYYMFDEVEGSGVISIKDEALLEAVGQASEAGYAISTRRSNVYGSANRVLEISW